MDSNIVVPAGYIRGLLHYKQIHSSCRRVIWPSYCNALHAGGYQSKTSFSFYPCIFWTREICVLPTPVLWILGSSIVHRLAYIQNCSRLVVLVLNCIHRDLLVSFAYLKEKTQIQLNFNLHGDLQMGCLLWFCHLVFFSLH